MSSIPSIGSLARGSLEGAKYCFEKSLAGAKLGVQKALPAALWTLGLSVPVGAVLGATVGAAVLTYQDLNDQFQRG